MLLKAIAVQVSQKGQKEEDEAKNKVPDNCQTRNTLERDTPPKKGGTGRGHTYAHIYRYTLGNIIFLRSVLFRFFLDCLQFSYHLIKIAKFRTRFHFRFPLLFVRSFEFKFYFYDFYGPVKTLRKVQKAEN